MNEKGFTLSEVVIVLGVLSILILVVGRGAFQLSENTVARSIINQLTTDMSYAQARALENNEYVWVTFDMINHRYAVYSPTFRIERELLPHAQLTFSNFSNFKFNQYGNASNSGTIHLEVFDKKYKFVVLLGMGRFYVEEL